MSGHLEGDALAEWRQNWTVVLAAVAGVAVSTLTSYATALFYVPFEQEFGWKRADVASAHVIAAVATIFCAPFVGSLIDRFGPRRIGITAAITMCMAVAMMSLVGPGLWTWFAVWTITAIPVVLIQPTVWTSAITGLFTKGRGLALAVTLCGSGLASILTPRLTFSLIENLGWRLAFVALAGVWAVLTVPIIIAFFYGARDKARRHPQLAAEPPRPGTWGEVLRTEILTRRFIQLCLAGFCFAVVVVPTITNLQPILAANGIAPSQAAWIASFAGFASISGRLTIGLLLDRLPGRFIAAVSVWMPIAGSLILIYNPGSAPAALIAVLIFGLALGAELDIMAYLASRYFSLKNFGMLFGTIGAFITLAGGTGPVLLNAVYDATHSYVGALWGMIPVCLASSLLYLLLGPYPHPELRRRDSERAPAH